MVQTRFIMEQVRFFIDYRTAGLEGDMCILYGHNMLDGSMFKEIMNFRDKDFCKKHPTLIFILVVSITFIMFSLFFREKTLMRRFTSNGFENKSDFQSWIDRVYSKSTYKFDTRKPTTDDKIIMCSTCVDDYGTDSLFVCTEGKKLWIRDFHLILLRKRFKKLDKYSYAIDFCKEMM